LVTLGFVISEQIRRKILQGADFIQLKNGPFDLDLVHAPDGIASDSTAKNRSVIHDGFPVANLRDIIASKCASGRQKTCWIWSYWRSSGANMNGGALRRLSPL